VSSVVSCSGALCPGGGGLASCEVPGRGGGGREHCNHWGGLLVLLTAFLKVMNVQFYEELLLRKSKFGKKFRKTLVHQGMYLKRYIAE